MIGARDTLYDIYMERMLEPYWTAEARNMLRKGPMIRDKNQKERMREGENEKH